VIQDKVCIITGATSGIGKATAEALAEEGARVVLIARNLEKGKMVVNEIQEKTKNQNLDLLIADLSSQSAIRQVAAEFLAKYEHLHILINNAGIATRKRMLSPHGIEMTFAVNHLAYFLLTNLLLDRIKASAPARIINVSSEAHRNVGPLDFDNLQGEKKYGAFRAYSITKLCNVLFTFELAHRLEGTRVTANALHPGYLYTSIFREASALARFLVKLTAGRAEKGARAILHLAASPELEGITGKYFKGMKEVPSSPVSYDRAAAERLWQISSKLTGIQTSD
jgi:NAD(P)-dependent dehydrogenase (short-subunit alcohol dehydrogenase family)